MTPKEKAEQLFTRFNKEALQVLIPFYDRFDRKKVIKQCALIAVDEIIANIPYGFYSGIRPDYKGTDLEYLQEVKQEIEKL